MNMLQTYMKLTWAVHLFVHFSITNLFIHHNLFFQHISIVCWSSNSYSLCFSDSTNSGESMYGMMKPNMGGPGMPGVSQFHLCSLSHFSTLQSIPLIPLLKVHITLRLHVGCSCFVPSPPLMPSCRIALHYISKG